MAEKTGDLTPLTSDLVESIAALKGDQTWQFDVFKRKTVILRPSGEALEYKDPSIPTPKALNLTTLQGVVDYVTDAAPEIPENGKLVVHVESPVKVSVVVPVAGELNQQLVYAVAEPVLPNARIWSTLDRPTFHDPETFIIGLLAGFADTAERTDLLSKLQAIKTGVQSEVRENGESQEITTTRGVQRSEATRVKNPVSLVPYRSFPEAGAVGSPFIFRMQQTKNGDAISVASALIEGDGGGWRPRAISEISAWLEEKLPEGTVVLS